MKNRKWRYVNIKCDFRLLYDEMINGIVWHVVGCVFCKDKEAWRNNRVNRNRINARMRKQIAPLTFEQMLDYLAKYDHIKSNKKFARAYNLYVRSLKCNTKSIIKYSTKH